MKGDDYNIITAPVPINTTWWYSLTNRQQIALILYMTFYVAGTLFNTASMFIDKFYVYILQLESLQIGSADPIIYKHLLAVRIERGFWREDIHEVVDEFLSAKKEYGYIKTNLMIATEIWSNCQVRSFRGIPCHSAAIICLIFGMLILYYHCTTVALFRTFTILNVNLAAILLFIAMSMEYSAAVEFDYCVNSVFINRKTSGKAFVRGRYYNRTLNASGATFKLMMVGDILFFCPMLGLGCYLLFCHRENL